MATQDSTSQELADKQVFTTGEAAELCKVSQQTIIRCFDAGRLNGFRVPGSRFRRIPREELIKFMKDNGIPTETLNGGKRRILVVDDDPQIVELFIDLLSNNPRLELKTAANGYDAGVLTEQFKPDLMILDYMLPDINGNKVCQTVRQNPAHKDTKILFVSGVVDPDGVSELMDAGADDFLKKPFDIDELMGRIHSLLELA